MFEVVVDLMRTNKKVKTSMEDGQQYLDNAILKDSNYYIPADTWALRDSSLLHSKIGKGKLVWSTPYARRLYYNPYYEFSTDKNPNARGFWFENAKAQSLEQWLAETEEVVRKHF